MVSFLSLGRIHIPMIGLFAAAGLMCSLALGLRSAALARIDRDAFWDLGFLTVLSALVLSRVVLVVENLSTFLQFPIAVLELPSLTMSGILPGAAIALWYTVRRRIPLLGAMDAAAPCAALLWSFLNLGSWFDGTREGMPTRVPWSVPSSFGRVHPVEFYGVAAWLLIAAFLMALLARQPARGVPAAAGLILAGMANALLGFFRLPNVLYGDQRLDGLQWRGVEMIVLGGLLLAWRISLRPDAPPAAPGGHPHAV